MEKINVNHDYMIYTEEEKNSALQCLNNGDSSIFVGDSVQNFEQKLADYLGTKYALAFPNCTLAIYATLQTLGINPGDEVIVPNLTHASSIYPAIMSGAKLKVVDFKPSSYNYDIVSAEKLITDKTKFFLACYLYGMPLNIDEIKSLCEKYNIYLIEDTAQAFGTKINENFAGTFGNVGCYSFNDTKLLRIGEGGAIATNDKDIYEKLEHFRHVGEVFNSTKKSSVSSNTTYRDLLFNGLSNDGRGLNLRPSPLVFSTGIKRLEIIDNYIDARLKKLKMYISELSNIKGINIISNFKFDNIEDYAPLALWIVLDNKYYDRNRFILGALSMGIPIGSFNYNTIIKNDYFKKYIINQEEYCKNSQYIRDNSLFLPLYESLSMDDIKKIIVAFKYIVSRYNTNDKIFDERIYDENISYFDGFYLMRRKEK